MIVFCCCCTNWIRDVKTVDSFSFIRKRFGIKCDENFFFPFWISLFWANSFDYKSKVLSDFCLGIILCPFLFIDCTMKPMKQQKHEKTPWEQKHQIKISTKPKHSIKASQQLSAFSKHHFNTPSAFQQSGRNLKNVDVMWMCRSNEQLAVTCRRQLRQSVKSAFHSCIQCLHQHSNKCNSKLMNALLFNSFNSSTVA